MSEQEKRRMQIAGAVELDFEQRQEVERVIDWLTDFPDEAATYIVWLESMND